ncbi:MAG: hypothetical protein DRJ69_00465 [Thermoprotei archaeon]|nr:MAG: hypothetical protein DRJ69_00465 [Thermoprotei archaeon]
MRRVEAVFKHGKPCLVIDGRAYPVDEGDECYIAVVPINALKGLRLYELPEGFQVLPVKSLSRGGVSTPLFPGRVLVSGGGSLTYEYWEVPKYYRVFLPVDDYVFNLVVRAAEQAGFKLVEGAWTRTACGP